MADDRRDEVGDLPIAAAIGAAIAQAATDPALPSGQTVVVEGQRFERSPDAG